VVYDTSSPARAWRPVVVAGEVSDSWIYGLLKRDWKAEANAVRVIRILHE
jgi:hypothetical protein